MRPGLDTMTCLRHHARHRPGQLVAFLMSKAESLLTEVPDISPKLAVVTASPLSPCTVDAVYTAAYR
jgi:hypothetical protein